MTTNEQMYYEMVLKGMELKQPQHYTDDLHVHDRISMGLIRPPEALYEWELEDGAPFVWIVRDCGTELIYAGRPTKLGGAEDNAIRNNMSTLSHYMDGGFSYDNVHVFLGAPSLYGPVLIPIELGNARKKLNEAFCRYEQRNDGQNVHSLVS